MESALILSHVYQLNWHMPIGYQEEAMDWLQQLPAEDVHLLFQPYAKACWENAVTVVRNIGYPRNEGAYPAMMRLLEDENQPGATDAMFYFLRLGRDIVAPHLHRALHEASVANDARWEANLQSLAHKLNIIASSVGA